jgi:hypothetical protein
LKSSIVTASCGPAAVNDGDSATAATAAAAPLRNSRRLCRGADGSKSSTATV